MMNQLRKDLMQYMKHKNVEGKELLQLIIAGAVNKEKQLKRELDYSEFIGVISKEVKQMNDSLGFAPEDRVDIIEPLKAKIIIAQKYLPKQMTEADIEVMVNDVIHKLPVVNKGMIMKTLMPMVKGKADGRLVNKIVENALCKIQ